MIKQLNKVISILFMTYLMTANHSSATDMQMHLRVGPVSSSFTGPTEGSFLVPLSFNLEIESFFSNKNSYKIGNILSFDLDTAKVMYSGTYIGARYYILTKGRSVKYHRKNSIFSSIPQWRIYGGVDFILSQVIVKTFGTTFNAISSLLEAGLELGVIYQVGKRWGIEINSAISLGWGFSSISVSGNTMRGFLGVVYSL